MKKRKKTRKESRRGVQLPQGLVEFLVAVGILAAVIGGILGIRACGTERDIRDGVLEDVAAGESGQPTSTVLNPLTAEEGLLPLLVTEDIRIDALYTATGYFPEDGTDEAIENVLAVKLTNTAEKTLEYLTFTLTVNGEAYPFSAATVPGGTSVYVFARERNTAPGRAVSASADAEIEVYFPEEPSVHADSLSYEVRSGTVDVTNISGKRIGSDILVYYKSTAENGYLGGITYRFRISGGLEAGESFSAYAPHAYAHMTEIMFAQYEK